MLHFSLQSLLLKCWLCSGKMIHFRLRRGWGLETIRFLDRNYFTASAGLSRMKRLWHWKVFLVTGALLGESTSQSHKGPITRPLRFLWCQPKQTMEQELYSSLILNTKTLRCRQSNGILNPGLDLDPDPNSCTTGPTRSFNISLYISIYIYIYPRRYISIVNKCVYV